MAGTRFGPVHWFTSIDSTNRYLLAAAEEDAPTGLVAVADEQTAGRGRMGRSWQAAPGASLLVSVLLRPDEPREQWPLMTLVAALAAADAVAALAGVEARLKWPNDLVVTDRKLAGLLAEAVPSGALVVGMGLNVHWDDFPPDLADIATACNLCGDRAVTREELLVVWLQNFDARLRARADAVPEAEARSATVGREVRVELAGETITARATGLDASGRLVIERADGTVTHVAAGDVIHVRPAP